MNATDSNAMRSLATWPRQRDTQAGANRAGRPIPCNTGLGRTGLHWLILAVLAVLAALLLSACGGSEATETAPSIINQPQSVSATVGATASFTVVADGSGPLGYQWRKNGADIAGATGSSYTTSVLVAADNGAQFSVVVSNSAGSVTSVAATLTAGPAMVAPSITSHPSGTSVVAPAAASFAVTATGSAPLTYQWRRNGIAIAGATAASHTTPATNPADDGALYSVVVSNAGGQAISIDARLLVAAAAVAPTITTQPAAASVNAGQTAGFTVSASGTAPLAYQWRRNGVAIAGATGANYTTPILAATDDGARYSVVVSNAAGSVSSADATLTVTAAAVAPSITAQPASATVAEGMTASFTVVATGTAPLTYRWRKNDIDIPGATAPTYTTAAATAADSGAKFSVLVTNIAGTATSNNATLTVTQQWSGVKEDGTMGRDTIFAVATDPAGNVAVAGRTDGVIPGTGGSGLPDPFVAKYRANGTLQWLRSVLDVRGGLGTTDGAYGVATDSAGNVYATGSTVDALGPDPQAGGHDVFVVKYDPDGNRLWTRLIGSPSEDAGRAIAVDAAGNVFVVGDAQGRLPLQSTLIGELFIAKFDTNGNLLWLKQWGSGGDGANRDSGRGLALDAAGNAYVAGYIPFNYAGTTPGGSGDGFAAKYDTNGNQVWFSRLRGLGPDQANAIAVSADGNTIYLTGRTNSDFDLPAYPSLVFGQTDAFIARLDGGGTILWAHNLSSVTQAGPTYYLDVGTAISTTRSGGTAFMTGYTMGVMPGEVSRGAQDAFVARYESDGSRTWVRQYGGSIPSGGTNNLDDQALGIAMDLQGDLFVVGDTVGTWGAPNPQTNLADWFVIKIRPADGSLY